jgi:hypothetical protein
MSLGDAKKWLTRQEGDPARGWISPERLRAMLEQIYEDIDMMPKHHSHTTYAPGAQVWWGDPPRIYTAPRGGIPARATRPGEPGSVWLDGNSAALHFAEDLPEIPADQWVIVQHGLGTLDVLVQVRRADTNVVLPNQPVIQITGPDAVSVAFPGEGSYQPGELRIVIVG